MAMHRPIFFLSDFSTSDPWVGLMKAAAIARGHRGALIDLTHEIPPQDVRHGAIVLEDCLPWLPAGAVVVAVVDPGVGSARRPLAVEAGDRHFIGPDNGLLTAALAGGGACRVIAMEVAATGKPISTTFHGRDIFAPAGALLAAGAVAHEQIGPLADPPAIRLDFPEPRRVAPGHLRLTIVTVDRFGNLATNLKRDSKGGAPECSRVSIKSFDCGPPAGTFSDVPPGHPVAYYNSFGRLEIAVNRGSAARHFQAGVGDEVDFFLAEGQ